MAKEQAEGLMPILMCIHVAVQFKWPDVSTGVEKSSGQPRFTGSTSTWGTCVGPNNDPTFSNSFIASIVNDVSNRIVRTHAWRTDVYLSFSVPPPFQRPMVLPGALFGAACLLASAAAQEFTPMEFVIPLYIAPTYLNGSICEFVSLSCCVIHAV